MSAVVANTRMLVSGLECSLLAFVFRRGPKANGKQTHL